ncbi:hypothetical protein B0T25DRAFT_606303 [Lasiosphaeria hispida]|uniref:Uncharacterized protein n=1 Tax=Lasiosphaeria hispida TaxID=260671 RepID=A0AAJ0MDH4_9PEZI|nr:hypothetical protein B0T25DRAFT_606303 [Lasiosphaeria hispida]
MIEKNGLTPHNIDEYDVNANLEELPPLEASDNESTHNLFIIRSGVHSAIVDIVCSPTRNPIVPWKNHRFEPVDEKGTCEARTQESSSFFTTTKTQLKAADREAERRHRNEGQGRSSGGGGGLSTKENHTAKDKQTVQNILKKLKAGIEEVLLEDLNQKTSAEIGNAPANSHRQPADEASKLATDEGDKLERQLWEKATELEETGREAAWIHRLMFSTSRHYRRTKKEDIIDDPDERAQQKRWELGGRFLNKVVNKLYQHRKALAFVVYRAAWKKSLVFWECTNTSSGRQKGMLDAVVKGLRFVPITVSLQSRVVLPPAYLSFKRELEYSEVCTSLELSTLACLSFTRSELVKFAWEMPLALVIQKEVTSTYLKIQKNGVWFLTDSHATLMVAPSLSGSHGGDERSEPLQSETTPRQRAFQSDSSIHFIAINQDKNTQALRPEETQQSQGGARYSSKKRPGDQNSDRPTTKRPTHRNSGAIRSRHADCHSDDPPLRSPFEHQYQSHPNDDARRLDPAEYRPGPNQSGESQDEDQLYGAGRHADQLPDVTTSADINWDDTPSTFTFSFTMRHRPRELQPDDEAGAATQPERHQHGEPPTSSPNTDPAEPGVSEQEAILSQMMRPDFPQLSSTASSSTSHNADRSRWGAGERTDGASQAEPTNAAEQATDQAARGMGFVNPTLLGRDSGPLSQTPAQSAVDMRVTAALSEAVAQSSIPPIPENTPTCLGVGEPKDTRSQLDTPQLGLTCGTRPEDQLMAETQHPGNASNDSRQSIQNTLAEELPAPVRYLELSPPSPNDMSVIVNPASVHQHQDADTAGNGDPNNKPRLSSAEQLVPNSGGEDQFMWFPLSSADIWPDFDFVDRGDNRQTGLSAVDQLVPNASDSNDDQLMGFLTGGAGHWSVGGLADIPDSPPGANFSSMGNLFSSPTP